MKGAAARPRPVPAPVLARGGRRAGRALAAAAVAMAAALAVHWPALRAGALCFDDSEYLVENPRVRQPGAAHAWHFLTEVLEPTTVHGYYQPLTMISLMLDAAAGGRPDRLMPFHRTSLILHAANAALAALILYELIGHAWAAGVLGVLFAVHPMAVETIAWVGERKTVLAAFFALLSVWSYVRYARRGGRGAYLACAVLFALALLSKPTVTLLPVCLLVLDVWPLNRLGRRALIEKLPLLAIAAASAWITFESQRRTAITVLPTGQAGWQIPLILCHNIVFYLRRLVLPIRPSAHYPMPQPISLSDANMVIGVIGTIVLIAALAVSLRRTRALAAGWLFFFVAILPAMGVIGFSNVIAADKFAYWPSLGLMLPAAWLFGRVWDGWAGRVPRVRRGAMVGVAAALAVAAAAGTRTYLARWADTERLFRYMLTVHPEAPTLHLFLGKALADRDRDGEAEAAYRRAIALAPTFEVAHLNLGLLLNRRERTDEAIAHYEAALRVKPDFYEAHQNLGNALVNKRRLPEAIKHLRAAERLRPASADAHYNLANALAARDERAEAIDHYQQTLALDPDHGPAHKNLGTLLLVQGRRAEAAAHYHEALRIEPAWWDVANQLAWLHGDPTDPSLHDPAEAVRCAQLACQATARREPVALATLAVMLSRAGRTDEAQRAGREAIERARQRGDENLVRQIEERLGQEPRNSPPARGDGATAPARRAPPRLDQ